MPIPKAGDLSVVTRWDGQPVCVIETTRVEIHPSDEGDADSAATEGEGDGSLAYWREARDLDTVRLRRAPTLEPVQKHDLTFALRRHDLIILRTR